MVWKALKQFSGLIGIVLVAALALFGTSMKIENANNLPAESFAQKYGPTTVLTPVNMPNMTCLMASPEKVREPKMACYEGSAKQLGIFMDGEHYYMQTLVLRPTNIPYLECTVEGASEGRKPKMHCLLRLVHKTKTTAT